MSHKFFRLFGDLNGNRRVTVSEYNQIVVAFENVTYNRCWISTIMG